MHGNTKKIPAGTSTKDAKKLPKRTSISTDVWKHDVLFIRTYGTQHGLVLPGRIPGFRAYNDLLVLPSHTTKLYVFELYERACREVKIIPIKRSSWYVLWDKLCSNEVIQAPKSDLCVTCKNSILSFGKLHNLPEPEKKKRIQESLDHLKIVEAEREHYRAEIAACATWYLQNLPADVKYPKYFTQRT